MKLIIFQEPFLLQAGTVLFQKSPQQHLKCQRIPPVLLQKDQRNFHLMNGLMPMDSAISHVCCCRDLCGKVTYHLGSLGISRDIPDRSILSCVKEVFSAHSDRRAVLSLSAWHGSQVRSGVCSGEDWDKCSKKHNLRQQKSHLPVLWRTSWQ